MIFSSVIEHGLFLFCDIKEVYSARYLQESLGLRSNIFFVLEVSRNKEIIYTIAQGMVHWVL